MHWTAEIHQLHPCSGPRTQQLPPCYTPHPAALWHKHTEKQQRCHCGDNTNEHQKSTSSPTLFQHSGMRWGEKLVYSFQCIKIEKLLNCLKKKKEAKLVLTTACINSQHIACTWITRRVLQSCVRIYWVSIDFNKPFEESFHGAPKLSTHPPTCIGCWMFFRLLLCLIGGSQQLWRTGHSSPSRQHYKAEQDIPGVEPKKAYLQFKQLFFLEMLFHTRDNVYGFKKKILKVEFVKKTANVSRYYH